MIDSPEILATEYDELTAVLAAIVTRLLKEEQTPPNLPENLDSPAAGTKPTDGHRFGNAQESFLSRRGVL